MTELNNIREMLNSKSKEGDDSRRLDKLNKKINTLLVLFFGYLLGHFIGCLLF